MNNISFVLKRNKSIQWQNTQRGGIQEHKLLSSDESSYQNIVTIKAEAGATVEMHKITTSESIYVLSGSVEVISPDSNIQVLETGDFCHFHPCTTHGLRVTKEPTYMLVIFAPPQNNK